MANILDMKHWRVWLGITMLLLGFGLREHAHALAAQDWVMDTAERMSSNDPNKPPACVFDCYHRLSGDAALIGWFALAMTFAGTALLVWSWLRRVEPKSAADEARDIVMAKRTIR
jgi:hypothetical protein